MALSIQTIRTDAITTFIVDSFTDRPFAGNPAGVCFTNSGLKPEKMLQIANELGLSETAFVTSTDKPNTFTIRFFSPKMEIPLCGHATLAAYKAMSKIAGLADPTLHFMNIQMIDLKVMLIDDLICMTFPLYQTTPSSAPEQLLKALGISSIKNAVYNAETKILLLEIDSTKELAQLSPDFNALYHSHDNINGVLVTAPSLEGPYDFHSRYFWPWSGTNEDPATGGTHTFLAPYWSTRLGKNKLKSFQSSKRTGWMDLEIVDNKTLIIKSQACIVFEGLFHPDNKE